jgi:peptide/nickel transport system ATP-binding protein
MFPLLEINELTISFQGEKAIDNISLKINRGETLGIVGESGSGKSLTSLAIMQLLSKQALLDTGKIVLQLKDKEKINLTQLSEKELRKMRGNHIAMIFQEPMTSLNPVMTCGKQVNEVLMLHKDLSKKEATEKTLQLFEEVKLPRAKDIFNSYPHELSGGQKQRIMIAMAMACEPALLIADEPTTALDVSVQQAILDLIQQLKEKYNTTTIFISHDLNLVSNIADQIAVIYQGKIVEKGATKNIFSNPKHSYTKGLLGCRPPLNKRLKRLPLMEDFLSNSDNDDNRLNYLLSTKNEISEVERQKKHFHIYKQKPLLEVKNLAISYPQKKSFFGKVLTEVKAVDLVSFSLFRGETLGLVGESGCGKTSLGRSLLLLNKPSTGKILFEEKEILKFRSKEIKAFRKKAQIIFQDPYGSLNPRITAGAAIMEPMTAHNLHKKQDRKHKTIELLEKVGLTPSSFNRYPHEFSGGQRQRISIARALAVEPELLICDESVSALDVSVQAQILNLLNQLKEELKLTFLFISHDLSVVRYMSDRIMVMKAGKIIETKEADELFTTPEHNYTKKLLAAIPKQKT